MAPELKVVADAAEDPEKPLVEESAGETEEPDLRPRRWLVNA
jgi:hypothetical protein